MAEKKSTIRDQETCVVEGCGKIAERSVSGESAREAKLQVDENIRRAYLCKEHYKQYKKSTKKDRLMESLGR